MHKFLIAAVLSLFATIANAAPSCMSRQACIDSDNGYCRYTPTDNGRCWSTDRAFLKKVKAGKAGRSVRHASKPPVTREPKIQSEPDLKTETATMSEPFTQREPKFRSEPPTETETISASESQSWSEPKNTSEPPFVMETSTQSEPLVLMEPKFVSEPRGMREPYRPSWEITFLGIFAFASAFLGFNAAKILQENPIYWGFPKLPPPPLDLAKSPYRLVPASLLPEPSPTLLDFTRFVGEARRRVH